MTRFLNSGVSQQRGFLNAEVSQQRGFPQCRGFLNAEVSTRRCFLNAEVSTRRCFPLVGVFHSSVFSSRRCFPLVGVYSGQKNEDLLSNAGFIRDKRTRNYSPMLVFFRDKRTRTYSPMLDSRDKERGPTHQCWVLVVLEGPTEGSQPALAGGRGIPGPLTKQYQVTGRSSAGPVPGPGPSLLGYGIRDIPGFVLDLRLVYWDWDWG